MKKEKIKIIFLVIIFLIMMCFFYKITLKKYEVNYKLDNFEINEKYNKKNKNHIYDITIKEGKNKYTYSINENFNKNKKIINNIKKYKKGNVECIYPEYIKNKETQLYCKIDKKQVSNYFISENENFKEIVKKSKIKVKVFKNSELSKKYKKIDVFYENINDEIITLWDYKGIYLISKDNEKYIKFIDYDLYDNLMSIMVKNKYILFENSKVIGIKKIYVYDIKKDKVKEIEPNKIISKNSYINGVFDNKVYITDLDKKNEYTFDIKKNKIEQVNNYNEYLKYKDGEKIVLSKSDYFMKKQYFNNEIQVSDSKEYIEENGIKYYIEDNVMHYKKGKGNIVSLFELKDVKEWKVINDKIVLISGDNVYIYDDKSGLKKIIKSKEIKYNYKDICKIYS